MKNTFLPVNKKDMFALGWDRPDILQKRCRIDEN